MTKNKGLLLDLPILVIARDAVVLGCMSKGSGNPGVLHTSLDYPIKLDNDKYGRNSAFRHL
jgi:hypothetical protein